MQVKLVQSATKGPSAVALLELELEPGARPLYLLVLHLPPDARGRSQDWSRTEPDQAAAFEMYDRALHDHIAPETTAAE